MVRWGIIVRSPSCEGRGEEGGKDLGEEDEDFKGEETGYDAMIL